MEQENERKLKVNREKAVQVKREEEMVATKIKEMHEKIYAAAKMNQIKKAQ